MNIQNTRSLYSSTHCTHVLWKNVGAFCHCVSVRVCMFDENSMSFKDFFFLKMLMYVLQHFMLLIAICISES